MKDIFDLKKNESYVICTAVIFSMFFVPSILAYSIKHFIDNIYVYTLLGDIIYLFILVLIFRKSLKKDIKNFLNNKFDCVFGSFKYYFVGLVIMMFLNIITSYFGGGISDNETLVRESIFSYPILMAISACIFGPIIEELVFRKSILNCISNKYIGSLISAFIFGLAHVISYIDDPINLIYLVPYASLGYALSYMDYKSNSVCSSIIYHILHNSWTFILIYITYLMGLL